MHRDDLMDHDGENKAIRSFLRYYQNPEITIVEMRENMDAAGWDGCWPEWVTTAQPGTSLTKASAQAWIRHLISLEQAPSAVAVPDAKTKRLTCGACASGELCCNACGTGVTVPVLGNQGAAATAAVEHELAEMCREFGWPTDGDAEWLTYRIRHQVRDLTTALKAHTAQVPAAAPADAGDEFAALVAKRHARIRASLLEGSNTNRIVKLQPSDAAVLVDVLDGRVPTAPGKQQAPSAKPAPAQPIPLSLSCPECGVAHLDEGEWATRLHKTHQCLACKHEWRPYDYPTVGVAGELELGTDRIEAICRAFEEGVEHGIERDGENGEYEDPAQTAAFILGYNSAAATGGLIGNLAADRRMLDWLGRNFSVGVLDEMDVRTTTGSVKWEFFAPAGVQGDIREVLRAALVRAGGDTPD
jgi:hypothetical protein